MFFIGGINSEIKELISSQMVICSQCGSYGRYQVTMTCMCLSLFFIPVFRWKRRYYVTMSCCDSVYELNPEVGKRLARGEKTEISEADLTLLQRGQKRFQGWEQDRVQSQNEKKVCRGCGYETAEDFAYCPKCGQRLEQ